ncbi:MAG: hypothetical protein A3E57_03815 [Candidatus Muproteobacteria bacterium RIFCSPHIGHO2_12_FULL_60_33]|uniref:Ig-like domain-containing protein n=1 Tax=Candidatus Muproteobacteria bacterium RIFCSPLOWO2_01_FULL_60_18 TaxID=1817768 RepID=A0A1F6TYI8_9PROT|nr:MAG: hypothetical protein A3A87_07530 [Candidatus Muproteobacteria bacterium RIFCSPLOWO2_01_FULL_60_18]OGI53681.1 MAG: hypothetical protein A2W42_04425 [Candidatus Muproteobacteria bacterium RIFCSPHIGHO2_01_60_12]OGI56014.1 MAG: hypothetical protein A3E57_03815 [Candidatus Muproteobacteria bacterium RIFCSPHIGHO2_12_FULL_60_33]OGI58597.1 MAG: hypothetical protein A2809_02940 [Candidatus Muproteobacteria bacterium RIFCSPHIGHO2_01_FULL_61_200]
MRLILLALTAIVVAGADVLAAEATAPLHTRPYTVKCAATINVWVEVDSNSLPERKPTNIESKKRVQFSLIGSTPYRGDSVLCNYATRRRDVATSYSIRCLQPRKERGYKHSYFCH